MSRLVSLFVALGLAASVSACTAGPGKRVTAAIAAPITAVVPVLKAEPKHWSYSGEEGPEHWADMSKDFAACETGLEQSPIDLTAPVPANAPAPMISWSPAHSAEVVNNGHTIQVNVYGAGGITLDGKQYGLVQFHFHHQSEHLIDGRRAPMEMHFVHQATDGALAVIGVMIERGEMSHALTPIWNTAPVQKGSMPLHAPVDPRAFLPHTTAHYQYAGSLTTPPCSETVAWTVMRDPMMASEAQIGAFAWLFPNNARPVQPTNRRFVLATP